jgi:hypothetical protein
MILKTIGMVGNYSMIPISWLISKTGRFILKSSKKISLAVDACGTTRISPVSIH